MSKRVESRSSGLPHRGHSLGVVCLCFRFLTTSRRWRSASIGFSVAPYVWFLFCCLSGLLYFYVVLWVA